VAFRSHHPDEATIKDMLKAMQDTNFDTSQLVEMRTDHCQQVESSKEEGSSE
jgi:hypothetical protein